MKTLGKTIFSFTLTGDKNMQLENVHSVGVTFPVLLVGSHTGRHPRLSALWLRVISVTTSRRHQQPTSEALRICETCHSPQLPCLKEEFNAFLVRRKVRTESCRKELKLGCSIIQGLVRNKNHTTLKVICFGLFI